MSYTPVVVLNLVLSLARGTILLFIFLIIVVDLLSRVFEFKGKLFEKMKKEGLTATNYLGIGVLLLFAIWPLIQEANIGNFAVKKLETRLAGVESTIQDLYGRKELEYIIDVEELKKLKNEKIGEFYHYEIQLKNKPIKKSVELWLGKDLQNPTYYSVYPDEKKIVYRSTAEPDSIFTFAVNIKPAITVQYIREQ